MATTETEISWLAGILDGEGCIMLYLHPADGHHTCRVQITNTDVGIIEEVKRILQEMNVFYSVYECQPKGNKKNGGSYSRVYYIEANRHLESKFLLERLLPYLKSFNKKEKAIKYIQYIEKSEKSRWAKK